MTVTSFDFVISEKNGPPQVIFKGGNKSLFIQYSQYVMDYFDTHFGEIIPQTTGDDDNSHVYRFGKNSNQKNYQIIPL